MKDILTPVYLIRRGKSEYMQLVKPKRGGGFYAQFTIDAYNAAVMPSKKMAKEAAVKLIQPGESWAVVEFRKHQGGERRDILTMEG